MLADVAHQIALGGPRADCHYPQPREADVVLILRIAITNFHIAKESVGRWMLLVEFERLYFGGNEFERH